MFKKKQKKSARAVAENENHLHIGKSVVIHGNITSLVDTMVHGGVEGDVVAYENATCLVSSSGNVSGSIYACKCNLSGGIVGKNIVCGDSVTINGVVFGDVVAPKVLVLKNAMVHGKIFAQNITAGTETVIDKKNTVIDENFRDIWKNSQEAVEKQPE